MKKILLIVLIIAMIFALLYIWVRLAILKTEFKFAFKGIDLSQISLKDFISGGETKLGVDVIATIINRNNFQLTFSDLDISFYYNGLLIGRTAQRQVINKITVPARSEKEVVEKFDLFVNSGTIDIIRKLKNKEQVDIKYAVQLKAFGLPFAYTDTFKF